MPNLIRRLGSAIKSAWPIPFPGGYVGPAGIASPRRVDFVPYDGTGRLVNLGLPDADGCDLAAWENSCVGICLNWVVSHFPEPDLAVEYRDGDGWAREEGHPLISLMDDPAPGYPLFDFHTLWAGAIVPCLADGDAYWLKGRDGTGAVRELWPVPHGALEPIRLDAGRPDYLYRYTAEVPGIGPVVKLIEATEVVHFRWGLPDPCNDLKSIAPLRLCLQERISDTEAARYTSAILRNRGVPGLMVIFDDDYPLTEEEADAIKVKVARQTTGRARGEPIVFKGKAKIESPGFSPDQLALTEITRIPEARLCAALGVPPMVVDLSVGDTQKSYANQDVAARKAWQNLRPLQNRMAEAIYRQLLPDFEADRRPYRVVWDYARVEALQEDRDAASKRVVSEFAAGIRTRDEAREKIGLPPIDGDTPVFGAPAPTTPAGQSKAMTLPDPDDAAARLVKRLEARLDADDAGGRDAGDDPAPPVQGQGKAGTAGDDGQPARPAGWEADRQADDPDLPGDGEASPGEPDDGPGPGPVHPAAGEGVGPADPALPGGVGTVDAGPPGPSDGLDAGQEGE